MNCTIPLTYLLLVATLSSCGSRPQDSARIKDFALMQTAGTALTHRVLLDELRENRISNVVEELEYSLDCSILTMAKAGNATPATKQQMASTLALIKDYRTRHPRKLDTDIDAEELESRTKTAEEAQKVLNAIE